MIVLSWSLIILESRKKHSLSLFLSKLKKKKPKSLCDQKDLNRQTLNCFVAISIEIHCGK